MNNITKAQEKNLKWLVERGGSAVVDRYGRLLAKGETCQQGAFASWLKLIANGFIDGEGGRLTITERGYDHLNDPIKISNTNQPKNLNI